MDDTIAAIEEKRAAAVAEIVARYAGRKEKDACERDAREQLAALEREFAARSKAIQAAKDARLARLASGEPAQTVAPAAVPGRLPPEATEAPRFHSDDGRKSGNAEWKSLGKRVAAQAAPDPASVPATAWDLVHDRGLSIRDASLRMGLSKSDVMEGLAAFKPVVAERDLRRLQAMRFPNEPTSQATW